MVEVILSISTFSFFVVAGDFIDLNSDAVVTAIQYSNVDGETNYKKESFYPHARDSDIQINRASGMLVKSKIDLDAFAALSGDSQTQNHLSRRFLKLFRASTVLSGFALVP